MNKIVYIFLLFLPLTTNAGEFNLKGGISLSDENSSEPEVDLPNPLGILRLEYETENKNIVFCEHISSIPKIEKGIGLNHCGILFEF